jgi:hypothetical protein
LLPLSLGWQPNFDGGHHAYTRNVAGLCPAQVIHHPPGPRQRAGRTPGSGLRAPNAHHTVVSRGVAANGTQREEVTNGF